MMIGRSARTLRSAIANASPRPSGRPTSTIAKVNRASPLAISSAALAVVASMVR
jgi:hypothetical protein